MVAIVGLFLPRRPAAIVRTVALGVVDPLKRQPGGTFPEVQAEVVKPFPARPALANRYSTTAVARSRFIATPRVH